MLLRVVVATGDQGTEKRLTSLVDGPSVLVQGPPSNRNLWTQMCRIPADLFVIGERVLPTPPEQHIAMLRDLPSSPDVIVITESDDPETHASLLSAGSDTVIYQDVPDSALESVLETALDRKLEMLRDHQAERFGNTEPRLSDFACGSPCMRAFMKSVHRVVRQNTPLLITGETGVGKEYLARAIHAESPRSEGPFVAVNCGALPESLLESELFGHEKGAFTGASHYRRGVFELAHGGTLFLDEITEMPPALQVRLLRVLEDHRIRPLGSETSVTVEVRTMAASNRNLEIEVQKGGVRRDLYYRLNVMNLRVPPLRDRREDIPELVRSYLTYLPAQIGCDVLDIAPDAMEALCAYDWPGNVRELINTLERAILLCDGEEIDTPDLPAALNQPPDIADSPNSNPAAGRLRELGAECCQRPWKKVRREVLDDLEKSYFSALLRVTKGNVGETARRAGIQPRSLYDKMKKHGLAKEDFRSIKSG